MSTRPSPTYLQLPAMYHWSPAERRKSIIRKGLLPAGMGPAPTCNAIDPSDPEWRQSFVCMSPSPHTAWDYSAGVHGDKGQPWDLWQIALASDDEVHVQPYFGPYIIEVRVANRIPKSRLWLAGTREVGGAR